MPFSSRNDVPAPRWANDRAAAFSAEIMSFEGGSVVVLTRTLVAVYVRQQSRRPVPVEGGEPPCRESVIGGWGARGEGGTSLRAACVAKSCERTRRDHGGGVQKQVWWRPATFRSGFTVQLPNVSAMISVSFAVIHTQINAP